MGTSAGSQGASGALSHCPWLCPFCEREIPRRKEACRFLPRTKRKRRAEKPASYYTEPGELWVGGEGGGKDSHPELVRGHRGMGAGSAVEKNLVPHGEEALGVFTPQREGGRKQSD